MDADFNRGSNRIIKEFKSLRCLIYFLARPPSLTKISKIPTTEIQTHLWEQHLGLLCFDISSVYLY